MHVLIVEDDAGIAKLYEFILNDAGVKTTVVTRDFEDIFSDLDWPGLDAIICDQMLGHVDGRDLLKRVCEDHPSVIRIMLTANRDAGDRETYADHLLHKPTDSLVILETLGVLK